MYCLGCQKAVYTHSGYCEECRPEMHAKLKMQMDIVRELGQRFTDTTGKEPLANWYEFEKFNEQQPEFETFGRLQQDLSCKTK